MKMMVMSDGDQENADDGDDDDVDSMAFLMMQKCR